MRFAKLASTVVVASISMHPFVSARFQTDVTSTAAHMSSLANSLSTLEHAALAAGHRDVVASAASARSYLSSAQAAWSALGSSQAIRADPASAGNSLFARQIWSALNACGGALGSITPSKNWPSSMHSAHSGCQDHYHGCNSRVTTVCGPQKPPNKPHHPSTTKGYHPPTIKGYHPPTTIKGYHPPTTIKGYHPPTTTKTYKRPTTTKSYQPSTTKGYKPPTTTKGYYPPTTTKSYQPPITTRTYQPPTTTKGYHPPTTTKGYHSPTTSSKPCTTTKSAPAHGPSPYYFQGSGNGGGHGGKGYRRSRRTAAGTCPGNETACPIAFGSLATECMDTQRELRSCGGCATFGQGEDCTDIEGAAGVGCSAGQCVVFSCGAGYTLDKETKRCTPNSH